MNHEILVWYLISCEPNISIHICNAILVKMHQSTLKNKLGFKDRFNYQANSDVFHQEPCWT